MQTQERVSSAEVQDRLEGVRKYVSLLERSGEPEAVPEILKARELLNQLQIQYDTTKELEKKESDTRRREEIRKEFDEKTERLEALYRKAREHLDKVIDYTEETYRLRQELKQLASFHSKVGGDYLFVPVGMWKTKDELKAKFQRSVLLRGNP